MNVVRAQVLGVVAVASTVVYLLTRYLSVANW
jgi:hypothetical protein